MCRSTPGCPTPVPRRPAGGRRAAGRRAGQGRHVRHPALLPAAVPATRRSTSPRWSLMLAVIGILYGGAAGDRPERHEAAGRLHLDRALRLHRARHLRVHHARPCTGAVLYMVNHGLATGAAVPRGRHADRPRRLATDRRLRRRAARSRRCWPGCSCSPVWPSLALPGTAPFVSEFLVLIGTFPRQAGRRDPRHRRHHPGRDLRPVDVPADDARARCAATRCSATLRAAASGPRPRWSIAAVAARRYRRAGFLDLVTRASSRWSTPLIALILVLGSVPGPVLDVINPAVAATMNEVGRATR